MKTKDRLAQALEEIRAPAFMIRKARDGYYDDFESPIAFPAITLVKECLATGRADMRAFADRVKEGEFDASKEEGDAWFEREGKDLFRK